jgi:hypothetical protein
MMKVPNHRCGVRWVPERPCPFTVRNPNTFGNRGFGYRTEGKDTVSLLGMCQCPRKKETCYCGNTYLSGAEGWEPR